MFTVYKLISFWKVTKRKILRDKEYKGNMYKAAEEKDFMKAVSKKKRPQFRFFLILAPWPLASTMGVGKYCIYLLLSLCNDFHHQYIFDPI